MTDLDENYTPPPTTWQALVNQEMWDLEHRMRRVEDQLAAQASADRTRIEARQSRAESWRWRAGTLVAVISCIALILSLHLF